MRAFPNSSRDMEKPTELNLLLKFFLSILDTDEERKIANLMFKYDDDEQIVKNLINFQETAKSKND